MKIIIIRVKKRYIALCLAMVFFVCCLLVGNYRAKIAAAATYLGKNAHLRLEQLEPPVPANTDDTIPGRMPEDVLTLGQLRKTGTKVPVAFVYHNPNFVRPQYKTYWHSNNGRYSYVPTRIHYAQHRVFATYAPALDFYNFVHELGVAELQPQFAINYEKPFANLVIALFNTQVEAIYAQGNQIVIQGKPMRTGFLLLEIPVSLILPTQMEKDILVQLVTAQGDELDYTLVHLPGTDTDNSKQSMQTR